MTRDFNRDLTIMVAGSGNVTVQNLEDSLGDWIFPNSETEREVHVILPLFKEMGPGIRNLVKVGITWGFTFTVITSKDAPMTRELSALPEDSFTRADEEREALELGLYMLTEHHKAGNETAFMHAYNPNSTYDQNNPNLSDYEILGEAKNYRWLQTLNLCESLVDSFEGFETTDEILKRERLQKEFEDKQREIEAAKPAPAKKAPAPRKRAAKKVEPQESKPLLVEPEKPLEEPSDGYDCACGGQTLLQIHTPEGCHDVDSVKTGPNPHRDPLPGNPVHDDPRNELSANVPVVISTPDIQEDLIAAYSGTWQNEKRASITVSKIDLAQLSTDIKELTAAFGNIMDTFTRILKDG